MTEIVIYCVCLKGAACEYELYIRCMVCNPPLTSHRPAFWLPLVCGFKQVNSVGWGLVCLYTNSYSIYF